MLLGLGVVNFFAGVSSSGSKVFLLSTYAIGITLLIFIVIVNTYPFMYLAGLRQSGEARRFRFGVLMFALLNLLAGYLWFYFTEVRERAGPFPRDFQP